VQRLIGGRIRRAPVAPPDAVDDEVPRDREQPGPERRLIADERVQVAHDTDERLPDDIVDIGHSSGAQVPRQHRRRTLIQLAPRPVAARLRRRERPVEPIAESAGVFVCPDRLHPPRALFFGWEGANGWATIGGFLGETFGGVPERIAR
jgi:hypothetical protein